MAAIYFSINIRKISIYSIKKKFFRADINADEWYITDLETVKRAITAVKKGRKSLHASEITKDQSPIIFRPEQKDAIDKKQETKSSNKKQDSKTRKQKVDTKKENSINKSETKKEKQNESKEVWDKLGISEYEYYNTPQWKWQTLNFELNGNGANSCKSNTECRNKCIEYGEEYITQHEGGYRCSEVLSYSGKYLGEYFKFFELEN